MKKYIKQISVVIVCILCFGMGISVSNIMNKNTSYDEWQKLESIYSILTTKWYYANQIEDLDEELIEQAISGMCYLEEDLHTNYFSLEQAQQFSSSLEGSNIGVGFSYYVNDDGNFVVMKTFVNSPADLAGIQKGDIITKIGDMVCKENESEDVVSMIQSSEGIELTVNYIRNDKEEKTTVSPTSYDSTVSCLIEDGYGIIQLNSFSENSAVEFNEALTRIKKAGIDRLIIDLRENTGGYLKSVLDISACLLPENSTVFIENNADGTSVEQKVSSNYSQTEMDSIVILQNGNTASASEVLIGALKDNLEDKVSTVGVTSYGKGTEQNSVPFTDGTSIKYTVAEWTTPNGTSINLKGFDPDYLVEQMEAESITYMTMEEDEIIEADSVHYNSSAIQTYLEFLGYDVDRKDEYFSPTSSNSLALFQQDNGLESTGNCDYETWTLLKDKASKKLNEHKDEYDNQLNKAIELLK